MQRAKPEVSAQPLVPMGRESLPEWSRPFRQILVDRLMGRGDILPGYWPAANMAGVAGTKYHEQVRQEGGINGRQFDGGRFYRPLQLPAGGFDAAHVA